MRSRSAFDYTSRVYTNPPPFMSIGERYFLMYSASVFKYIIRHCKNDSMALDFDPKFSIVMPFEKEREIYTKTFNVNDIQYDFIIKLKTYRFIITKNTGHSFYAHRKTLLMYDLENFGKAERKKLYDKIDIVTDMMKFDAI